MDAYTLYAVDVDVDTADHDVFIDQVSDLTVDTGIVENLLNGDGQVDPQYLSILQQQLRIAFSTTALATVLAENTDAFLLSGVPIDTDGGADGVDLFYQKLLEGGTRSVGADHMRIRVKKGIVVPRGIDARQGGNASLALEILPTWDGTNNPILIAAASLAGTPGYDECFTVGPCNINGVALDNVQSLRIDPGIAEMLLGGDGAVWNRFACIGERRPSIRIVTTDVMALSDYGLYGAAIGASDVEVFLRKRSEGGTVVADATAEHIKFTIYDGMVMVNRLPATHPGPAMAEITVRPRKGTNAIIAVDTTSAIA